MKSPKGHLIIGTFDVLNACAKLENAKIIGDKIAFDYTGDTETYDEDQKTVLDKNGQRVFVDDAGFIWSEDVLVRFNTKGKKK